MAGPKQQHKASIYQKCIGTIESALLGIKCNTKVGLHRVSDSYRKMVQIICPESVSNGIRPNNYTVVWSLATFILFIVLICVAVRVTTTPMRIGFASSSTGLFLFLTWIIIADLAFGSKLISFWSTSWYLMTPGQRQYRRNLSNTCTTAVLTVPLMTALYCFRWYPQLNTEILELSEGTVVSSHAFMSMHTDI